MTTIRNIIEALEDIERQNGDNGDIPVLVAHQPTYPLCETISALVLVKVRDGEVVKDENWCDDCGAILDDTGMCPSCLPVSERTPEDLEMSEEKPLVFVVLDGHPSEYSADRNAGFTSPYAPRGLWGDIGENFLEGW